MKDFEGVQFLQWCLPRLGLRWAGFRKVRRQVCTRADRRLKELGLADAAAYRAYLEGHPGEWASLDAMCRIPISRFYRDRGVFLLLEREVLPELARAAAAGGESAIRCWSIGCASGEEPYTLAILWKHRLAPQFPGTSLRLLATDADPGAIARAGRAWYPASSLKDLPEDLLAGPFMREAERFCVRGEYREPVTFQEQDIRVAPPDELFHLILCRNLAFTYFDDGLQWETLQRIAGRLLPAGALVIGGRESLPSDAPGFDPGSQRMGVYRRSGGPTRPVPSRERPRQAFR